MRNKLVQITVLVVGLLPILWFMGKSGILINGLDTNFPLDPLVWLSRRFFVWNSFPNLGVNFSSSMAGMFFHIIQVIPYLLGIKLQGVQIVSLVFWFAAVSFSSYIFARTVISKKAIPQLLFVVLYSFNIYLFNTWENIKVANLALVTSLPLILSAYASFIKGKIKTPKFLLFIGVIGILGSGAGINPAYFVCLPLAVLVSALILSLVKYDGKRISLIWFGFGSAVTVLLLINSFWLFPTGKYLFFSERNIRSLSDIGFTNWLNSLSDNTSLDNVLRLQGAWDWYAFDDAGQPLYIPYALNYFRKIPFIVFSFLLPALAIISLALWSREKKELYALLATFMIMGIFLGAGSHSPTGNLYLSLVKHLPFFSFFRSPWYIFTPFLILAISGLNALLFDRLSGIFSKRYIYFAAGVIIIGNFFYNYPLITGKIFRPGRQDSFFITFPGYVKDVQTWLEQNPNLGRIAVYPDDEIERFSWGYVAVETVLGLFYRGEVIFSPLSEPPSKLTVVIRQFYDYLKKGQLVSALNIGEKLGLGTIFVKSDQSSLAPNIKGILSKLKMVSFDEWSFYSLPREARTPKIFTAGGVYRADVLNLPEVALAYISDRNVLLEAQDDVVRKIISIEDISKDIVVAKNLRNDAFLKFIYSPSKTIARMGSKKKAAVEFEFTVVKAGLYTILMDNYRLEDFDISINKAIPAVLDEKALFLKIINCNDSYCRFAPVSLPGGVHKLTFLVNNRELISGGSFEENGILNVSGSLKTEIVQEQNNNYLSIINQEERKNTVDFTPIAFDPYGIYLIEVKFRQVYGDNPFLSLEQSNTRTLIKAQIEGMPSLPEWQTFSLYFQPVKTDSFLNIRLLAPSRKDSLGTKVYYDDLSMTKVFTNDLVLISETPQKSFSQPIINFEKKSPVSYRGKVEEAEGPHLIVFSENYSPGWQMKVFTADGQPLLAKPIHFSANLFSNGWYLSNMPKTYEFRIFYTPQQFFNYGLVVSFATVLGLVFLYLFTHYVNKKN